MAAATSNITIEQGATYRRQLTIKDSAGAALNLTGATFAGQIRESADSVEAVAAFVFAITSPATLGKVDMSLTSTVTAALPGNLDGVYDITLTQSGEVIRLLQGSVEVSPGVTR